MSLVQYTGLQVQSYPSFSATLFDCHRLTQVVCCQVSSMCFFKLLGSLRGFQDFTVHVNHTLQGPGVSLMYLMQHHTSAVATRCNGDLTMYVTADVSFMISWLGLYHIVQLALSDSLWGHSLEPRCVLVRSRVRSHEPSAMEVLRRNRRRVQHNDAQTISRLLICQPYSASRHTFAASLFGVCSRRFTSWCRS